MFMWMSVYHIMFHISATIQHNIQTVSKMPHLAINNKTSLLAITIMKISNGLPLLSVTIPYHSNIRTNRYIIRSPVQPTIHLLSNQINDHIAWEDLVPMVGGNSYFIWIIEFDLFRFHSILFIHFYGSRTSERMLFGGWDAVKSERNCNDLQVISQHEHKQTPQNHKQNR